MQRTHKWVGSGLLLLVRITEIPSEIADVHPGIEGGPLHIRGLMRQLKCRFVETL